MKDQAALWLLITFAPLIALGEYSDNRESVPEYAVRVGKEMALSYFAILILVPSVLITSMGASNGLRLVSALVLLFLCSIQCAIHLRCLLKEFLFPIGPSDSHDDWVKLIAIVRRSARPQQPTSRSKSAKRSFRINLFAHDFSNQVVGRFSAEVYLRLAMLFIGVRFFFACVLAIIGFGCLFYAAFLIDASNFGPATQSMTAPSLFPFLIASIGFFTTLGSNSIVPSTGLLSALLALETMTSLFLLTVFLPLVLMIFERNLQFWRLTKNDANDSLSSSFPDIFKGSGNSR